MNLFPIFVIFRRDPHHYHVTITFQSCVSQSNIYTKKVVQAHKKFIELWTDEKQTGDSALVQSKGMKTIYINSIRIIV